MASKARSLGNAGENGVVERARAKGLVASRQPGSGVYRDFPHDLQITTPGLEHILGESKVRSLSQTTKGAKTWTIDFSWLTETIEAAKKHGFSHAALFIRPKGSQKRFVLVEEDVYLSLLARSKSA